MNHSMIGRLNDCMEQNYKDFKAKTLATLTKEDIFELAGQISAMEDVRFFMSTYDWLDETEAYHMLSHNNPLEVLANVWKDFLSDSGCSFEKALNPLLGRDDGDPYEVDYDDYD